MSTLVVKNIYKSEDKNKRTCEMQKLIIQSIIRKMNNPSLKSNV